MSNPQAPEFDRHGNWQRWQMNELEGRARSRENTTATQHSKVAAAKRAAEQAYLREQQERQALYEQIRQQAEQEGYQAGLARGHQEGLEQGLKEGQAHAEEELKRQIHQTITPLNALAKQFSAALERIDDTIAHDLVELALATGKQLAIDGIQERPEQILKIVRDLLHTEPPLVGQQRLWLNPNDLALVKEHLGSELSAANWTLQPDTQLARGGCRVTSAQGELDATFESRWQAIGAQLRKQHRDQPRLSSSQEVP